MNTLVCLIGEQPIPNLLPIRSMQPDSTLLVHTPLTQKPAERLKSLVPNSETHSVPPYHVDKIVQNLQEVVRGRKGLIFNLTGGTKPMSLAAMSVAAGFPAQVVYLQSEGSRSLLYRYAFDSQGLPILKSEEKLPELITIQDYLDAHLEGYEITGFSTDGGGIFEKTVYHTLEKAGFEVLAGVRPKGVGGQIDIDLAIRMGNHVGVAEVKTGKIGKKGLDQLATVSRREYLGTYTKRFFICAAKLNDQLRELAEAHHVTVVELPNYRSGESLDEADKRTLIQTVRSRLSNS